MRPCCEMQGGDDSDSEEAHRSDVSGARDGRAPARGLDVGHEVAELREEVHMMQQELLTHRKVLEQFLELREGCMAVLGSSRIISEVGDKTAELELSLAGVSDNAARHGRAIGKLTEQQLRTQETLDAIVRAVKRIDRSRSRRREPADLPPRPSSRGSAPGAWEEASDAPPWLAGDCDPPVTMHPGRHVYEDEEDLPRDGPDAWRWAATPAELAPEGRCPSAARARTPSSRGGGSGGLGLDAPRWAAGAPQLGAPPRAAPEAASCAKGVLARIDEALAKLGAPPEGPATPGSHGRARGRHTPSASARRGAAEAAWQASPTARRRQRLPGESSGGDWTARDGSATWRAASSWA